MNHFERVESCPCVSEVDLNQRGALERKIYGAIVATIDAHGPLTRANATSASKRVISALKDHNRELRVRSATEGTAE